MPLVVHTGHAPSDHFSPTHSLAGFYQAAEPESFVEREELIQLAQKEEVVGLIIASELTVDEDLLQKLPHLKVVANCAAGYDNLDLEAMTQHGVWAANTPNSYADSTADAAMGLLLSTARMIAAGDRYIRQGLWPADSVLNSRWEGMQLRGRVMGIVGFGRIGQAVAERCRGFGMQVRVHRRTAVDSPEYRSLNDLLAESDVVCLTCPLTPETHHLINPQSLARIKAGAILINVARGKVVDEAALVEALQSGHLAGAGLDVFEEEPEVHPALREMENVTLAPHIGGATKASRQHSRMSAAESVAAVLQGGVPVHPLNQPQV